MNDHALAAVEHSAAAWSAWMFEMSLQVAVLATVVGCLAWTCRRRSASFRYLLWLVVLVRLATPPWLALPTGWGWWLRGETTTEVAFQEPAPQPSTTAPSVEGRFDAAIAPPPAVSAGSGDGEPLAPAETPGATRDVPEIVLPPTAPTHGSTVPSWAALLMIGWAGVSCTLVGLLMLGGVRTRRWVRQASPTLDPRLARILARCCDRLNISQPIGLRNSENCTTPLVVGWRRPVILLPACVPQQLEDDELEAVILHELNHVLRRDALVNFGQALLGAVYFFHPFVWWANAHIRRLREDACDELTVAALEGRRRAYGSALVKVSTILGYAAPPLALGVLESPHPAKRRLGRILDPNLPVGERHGGSAIPLAMVLALLFLPAGPRPAPSLADDSPQAPGSPPLSLSAEPTAPLGSQNVGVQGAAPSQAQTPSKTPDPAAESPQLRYRWTPGESIAFSIRLEAQDDEGVETRQGTVSYVVRSVGGGRAVLATTGSLHGFRRSHPGDSFPPRPPSFEFYPPWDARSFPGFPQERTLTVDERGRVESVRGATPLPFALGDLARLALVPLPEAGEREWRTSFPTRVELEEQHDNRFPRSPLMRATPEVLEAEEFNRFRLASWNDAEAVIERQWRLASVQTIGESPRISLEGEAEAVFDRQAGAVKTLRGRLTIVTNELHVSRQTRVTLVCQRLQPQAPVVAAPEIDPAQALADLDSPEKERVLVALRLLQYAESTDGQSAPMQRLRRLQIHDDAEVRDLAAQVFAQWATADDLPAVLDLLQHKSAPVRAAALAALGRLRAETAIEQIVSRLLTSADRVAASRALVQIGPACEAAVMALLDHEEGGVRLTAVNLLRDIGGSLSLPRLHGLCRNDPHENVRAWSQRAIESIEQRLAAR